ncbi:MAG: DUF2478 domain-containing protein [Elusimicrobia bacterium]|nr:DUF2478 domain-containing protein [Elusimicrobiota bacterium]
MASSLAESLRRSGASVGGVLAPGLWEEGVRGGFDAVDLGTGERRTFCRRNGPETWQALGAFRFSPEGLSFGLKALAEARRKDADIILIDEVGPLELQGQGWAPELDALAAERRKPMVWVVRSGLVAAVRQKWGLAQARVWEAGEERAEALLTEILPEAS